MIGRLEGGVELAAWTPDRELPGAASSGRAQGRECGIAAGIGSTLVPRGVADYEALGHAARTVRMLLVASWLGVLLHVLNISNILKLEENKTNTR